MDTFFPSACKKKILTSSNTTALFCNCACVYYIDIRKCYIISYRGLLYRDISIYRYIVAALVYMYMYLYIYIYVYIYIYTCMCTCTCTCIYIYMYIHACVHVHVLVYIYIHVCVCLTTSSQVLVVKQARNHFVTLIMK